MADKGRDRLPRLVFSDCTGKVYDHPSLGMAGRSGRAFVLPEEGEFVPLPKGTAGLPLGGTKMREISSFWMWWKLMVRRQGVSP